MKRILLFLLFVAPLFAGAQKIAKIQIVHNAPDPDLNIVDIYLNSEKYLDDFNFRKATEYFEIEAEVDSKIAIAPRNSTSVNDAYKSFDINLMANENYLAMFIGVIDAIGFQPEQGVTDITIDLVLSSGKRIVADNPDFADIIITNGSIDLPPINLKSRKDGTVVASMLNYKSVTNYASLLPYDQIIDLTKSDDPSTIIAAYLAEVGVENGNAFTVIASGFVKPELNKNGPEFGFYAVTSDGSVSEVIEIKGARVQLIHNNSDPSLETADVYRKKEGNWMLWIDDMKFRTGTGYNGVLVEEDFQIALAPGNSASIADTIKMFPPQKMIVGNREVFVLQGVNNTANFAANPNDRNIALQLKKLGPSNGADNGVELFFLHGSTDVQGIDVLNLGNEPIAEGLKYLDDSGSKKLPSQYTVFVLKDENEESNILATLGFDFTEVSGQSVTVIISGFKTPENNQNGEEVELILIDSMGIPFLFMEPDLLLPTNLMVTNVNQNIIDLSWVDNEPDANEFVLERSNSMDFANKKIIDIGTDITTYSDKDVTKLVTYFYRVKAVKSGMEESGYSNIIEVMIPDFIESPTELSAVFQGKDEVLLNWKDNSDNETGFVLERSINENMSDSVLIEINKNEAYFTDKNLDANTKYFYRIRAINENIESGYSNMADATTDDFIESPTKLEALGITSSTIILVWEDNSDNEDGFLLLRSLSENFNNADTIEIDPDIETYTDQDLDKNTNYFYKIKAFNSNVGSGFSATIEATTNDALSSPTDLIAMPMSPIQIDISWNDNSDDEDKFVLERSTDKNDFNGATIIEIEKDATSYSDIGLATGNTYWYRVIAMKGELSSSYSNLDSAAIGIYTDLAIEISTKNRIYPNPSFGSSIYLKLDKKINRDIDLNIISLSGQLVKQYTGLIQRPNLEVEVDVLSLKKGVYFIEVKGEKVTYQKLIRSK